MAALKVLKVLGRSPMGTSSLTSFDSFKTLSSILSRKSFGELSVSTKSLTAKLQSHRVSNLSSIDSINISECQLECLTIIANTLLLHGQARLNATQTQIPILCFNALKSSQNSSEIHFVAARCLFLCTLRPDPIVPKLVYNENITDVIYNRFLQYTLYITNPNRFQNIPPRSTELVTDLLKLFFNITLHHSPKSSIENPVLGESWDDKFNKLLQPLLNTFLDLTNQENSNAISPLPQPIPQIIHCSLCFPVKPLISVWSNPATATSFSPSATINRLSKTFSRTSIAQYDITKLNFDDDYIVMQRLIDLFNKILHCYWPSECIDGSESIDNAQAKTKSASVGINLDESLPPLIMLIRKLVVEDSRSINTNFKSYLRNVLGLNNIDRNVRMEQRGDLLGSLVKFLTASLFPSIKTTCGELLFALCDSDPNTMSSSIGFGNAAGFLFSKGLLSAGSDSSNGNVEEGVNPVTGVYENENDDKIEMTEEEKEAEAEKLFMMFDRLNRTGIIKTSNPMQDQNNQKRFEEIEEEDQQNELREEEEDEREVEEIMRKHKQRA